MFRLSNLQPFASGEERDVYLHPEDDRKCIKISNITPAEDFRPTSLRDWLFWVTRGRDAGYFDINFTDDLFYRQLGQRNDPEVFKHIPKCYGLVDTDLGKGLVCELIKNEDGTPCITMKQYIQEHGAISDKKVISAVEDFLSWLIEKNIFLREMGGTNTFFQFKENGEVKLYHIDAVGCLDLIPLANYWSWFSRLRIKIKINHLRRRKIKIKKNA
jgi:hypothetical protein